MILLTSDCLISIWSAVEVSRRWDAFHQLRSLLTSVEEFVSRWRAQVPEDYIIVYVAERDSVPAAAGYRLLHTMAWGYILYIDDLVVVESSRRRELGAALLRYLQDEARRRGCDAVHLDTGDQHHLAHRSYLRNGFHFDCHHLAWEVPRG